MSRHELEEKIIVKAWTDDAFRRDFVADPKGQFEARLGTKLPAELQMTVHEEDENHLHFVIPQKPKVDIAELSDADLEKVAGGVDIFSSVIVSVAVSLGVGGFTASAVVAIKTVEKGGWAR
jgi:hypothetical protein